MKRVRRDSSTHRAAKTVNNVSRVPSTLRKKAMEWSELERLPCVIKVLPNPKKTMGVMTSVSTSDVELAETFGDILDTRQAAEGNLCERKD